jgi:hypothetical protein
MRGGAGAGFNEAIGRADLSSGLRPGVLSIILVVF